MPRSSNTCVSTLTWTPEDLGPCFKATRFIEKSELGSLSLSWAGGTAMSGPLAAAPWPPPGLTMLILVLARGAPGGTRWAPGTSHQVGLEAPPSVCPFLPAPLGFPGNHSLLVYRLPLHRCSVSFVGFPLLSCLMNVDVPQGSVLILPLSVQTIFREDLIQA